MYKKVITLLGIILLSIAIFFECREHNEGIRSDFQISITLSNSGRISPNVEFYSSMEIKPGHNYTQKKEEDVWNLDNQFAPESSVLVGFILRAQSKGRLIVLYKIEGNEFVLNCNNKLKFTPLIKVIYQDRLKDKIIERRIESGEGVIILPAK